MNLLLACELLFECVVTASELFAECDFALLLNALGDCVAVDLGSVCNLWNWWLWTLWNLSLLWSECDPVSVWKLAMTVLLLCCGVNWDHALTSLSEWPGSAALLCWSCECHGWIMNLNCAAVPFWPECARFECVLACWHWPEVSVMPCVSEPETELNWTDLALCWTVCCWRWSSADLRLCTPEHHPALCGWCWIDCEHWCGAWTELLNYACEWCWNGAGWMLWIPALGAARCSVWLWMFACEVVWLIGELTLLWVEHHPVWCRTEMAVAIDTNWPCVGWGCSWWMCELGGWLKCLWLCVNCLNGWCLCWTAAAECVCGNVLLMLMNCVEQCWLLLRMWICLWISVVCWCGLTCVDCALVWIVCSGSQHPPRCSLNGLWCEWLLCMNLCETKKNALVECCECFECCETGLVWMVCCWCLDDFETLNAVCCDWNECCVLCVLWMKTLNWMLLCLACEVWWCCCWCWWTELLCCWSRLAWKWWWWWTVNCGMNCADLLYDFADLIWDLLPLLFSWPANCWWMCCALLTGG